MPMPDKNLSPKDYAIACWILACDNPKEFKPKQAIHDKVVASGLTDVTDFEEYKKAVTMPIIALYMLYLGQYHNHVDKGTWVRAAEVFNKIHKYKGVSNETLD